MSKEAKRNRKFRLIMAVRIIAIVIALVNLYLLCIGKFNRNTTDEDVKITSGQVESVVEHPPNLGDTIAISSMTEEQKQPEKSSKKTIPEKMVVEIHQPLLFKGKPLDGAYFTVATCTSCTSSRSGADGVARARIPKKLMEDDKEYDFYIYSADTLVYQKSMRFSDLQFNTYR